MTLNAWRPNQLFVLNVLYNVALHAAQARWCILHFTDFLDRLLDTLEKAQQLPGLATSTPWIGDIRNGACGVVLRSRRGRRRQPPRTCRILIEVAGFSLGGVTA